MRALIVLGLLLMVYLLAACQKVTVKLDNGEVVTCAFYEERACGYTFSRCEPGPNRYCQTNIEWIEK